MKRVSKKSVGVAGMLMAAFLLLPSRRPPDGAVPGPTAASGAADAPRVAPSQKPPPAAALPPAAPSRRSVAPAPAAGWAVRPPEPAFAAFHDWAGRYLASTPAAREALLAEGLALAEARRMEMLEMIHSDPERALALAVPAGVRQAFPAAVADRVEERVDARGDFGVLAAVPAADSGEGFRASYRTVSVGDRGWRAYTFGEALDRISMADVPLHGVALGGVFALHPAFVRVLDADEAAGLAAVEAVCAVSGRPATEFGEETPVDAGGHAAWLCSAAHTEHYNEALILAAEDQGNGRDADGAFRLKSTYTEGIKRLLVLRVDFPDLAGAPFGDAAGTNMLAGIDRFYREQSYGRTGFRAFGQGSAMTPTLRLARTAAQYGALDASVVRTDARNAARAAGFNLSAFDFDLVCFGAVPGFNWAGLGYVGAPGAWIRAAFDASGGVPAHELGHNFGLNHANFWDTGGVGVLGPGSNVEYGDSFDTMGNASGGSRHFNARYKNRLDWMPTAQVLTVATGGTYRVFAHDVTNQAAIRAIRIPRNPQTNYWLELRRLFTTRPALMNGLGVRWARTGSQQSLLLDTTPGTADGKNDSALLIGRTLSDPLAGIHITPVALGGTVPESMDVVVRIGRFTNNAAPTLALGASALAVAPNVPVTFTAVFADADGDAPAYAWTFGDGAIVAANTNRVTRSWAASGEYVVRCVASDMRGGVASRQVVVRVGTPDVVRISGRVLRDGAPVEGVRVEVSNTRQTFTDSDGAYVLAGLPRGPYTVKAVAEGLLFRRSGFANPLSVQAPRAGIDFDAALPGDLAGVPLVPMGAQWRYYDRGDLAGVGWRLPEFDDAAWNRGAAPLGYGDDNIVTVVGHGGVATNKHITTWFRHAFVVDDPARFQSATLGLVRDDGAAVFLNNREVFRSNLPTGTLTRTTRASSSVGGADETAVYEADVDPALFRRGTNVLAVEVHQFAPDSSDLRFALQLTALLPAAADAPKLTFATGERLRLAWPVTSVGFVLQESEALGAAWEASEATVALESGLNVAVLEATNRARFFRLGRP